MRTRNAWVLSLAIATPVTAAAEERPAPGEVASAADHGTEPASAAPPLAASAELLAATSYVWRGDRYSQDAFDPNLQPQAELSLQGMGPGVVTLNVWAWVTFSTPGSEVDPTLGYTLPLGEVLELSLGAIGYFLVDPGNGLYAYELMADLAFTDALPVQPRAGVALNPWPYRGVYGHLGASASKEWGPLTWTVDAALGASRYADVGGEAQPFGLQDLTGTLDVTLPLAGSLWGALRGGVAHGFRHGRQYPWAGLAVGAEL